MNPKVYMRLSIHHDQLGTRILRAEIPGYGAAAGYDPKRIPKMFEDMMVGALIQWGVVPEEQEAKLRGSKK